MILFKCSSFSDINNENPIPAKDFQQFRDAIVVLSLVNETTRNTRTSTKRQQYTISQPKELTSTKYVVSSFRVHTDLPTMVSRIQKAKFQRFPQPKYCFMQ